jgi:small subunit ribosomal protein S6
LNKYEGLFILDPNLKEDSLKQAVDKLQDLIRGAGGKVHNVQKLDVRPFARGSANRNSGFYVNFLFDAPAKAIGEMDNKLRLDGGAFRWLFNRHVEVSLPVRTRRESDLLLTGDRRDRDRDRDWDRGGDRDGYRGRDRDRR